MQVVQQVCAIWRTLTGAVRSFGRVITRVDDERRCVVVVVVVVVVRRCHHRRRRCVRSSSSNSAEAKLP